MNNDIIVDVYVDVWGSYTVTPSPAWTTLSGVEGDFAASGTTYSLTVSGFGEGESLQGWYVNTWASWTPIADTSNPRSFTFAANTGLEPLSYSPEADVKGVDEGEMVESKE